MRPAADSHSLNARLLRFRSDPDQEDAYALAEDLIVARRYGDARGVAVSAQTDDERLDARLLVLEARAWYLDRDLVRAQAALVRAARLDPDAHEVFRWLGEVLLQRGDPIRAVRALERALALQPGDADTQHLFERAGELAQNAEPLPPSNPPVASSPLPPPRERPAGVRAPAPGPTEQASIRPRPVRPSFEPQRAPSARAAQSASSSGSAPALRGGASTPIGVPAASGRVDEETTHSFRRERERVRPVAASEGFDDMSGGALDDPESTTSNNVTAQGRSAPGRTAPGAISAPGRTAPGNVSGRSVPGTLRGHSTPAGQSAPGLSAPNPASWSGNPTPLSALAPALRSSPGISSAPGRTAPGTGSAPGRTAPGASSAAGRTAPGAGSAPGVSSSPGRSSPGASSSPGISSASGRLSAPQRSSSPGTSAAPSSGAGRIASPLPSSSAGRLASPSAAGAAAPFGSSGGWVDGVGSPRGNGSAGHPHVAQDLDVDVDMDEPRARVATPQPPIEAPLFNQGRPIAASWDAPSVMAPWPLASDLAEQTEGDGLPLQALGTARTEPMTPVPGDDLELGASAGQADDPEQVLAMLREHGVFETSEARPSIWPPKKDVPRTGTRLRGALLFAWLSAIVLCGGGYFGWTQWVQVRHQKAADLTAQAKVAAFNSDYATLIDAERLLRGARELYPRSKEVPQLELFVHAARVLENGNRDLSTLRAALARAGVPALGVDAAHLAAARAVLAAYSSTSAEAAGMLDQARKLMGDQPELLYLVGRIEQRLGRPEADADLQAAAAKAPDLVAASLALAEEARDKGDEAGARAKLDAVLQRHPDHLRTRLWNAVLTADEQEPTAALAALQKLDEPAKLGAPVDRVLWGLSRARLSARAGQNDKAAEALRDALGAGASEPRLLALIAAEALRGNQLGTAQQAASQALALAPSAVTYRVLLARVLLARNDGSRVLDLIAQVPEGTPGLWTMRARAALQTGQTEAMKAALAAQAAQADEGLEQQALRLRLRAAVEPSSKLLSDAKSMLKRAPGDPEALRAVAEVALAQHQPSDATSASQQLIALMPEDAEGYHWLGRARRMAADAEGSERALRKALELSPGYDGALITLGGLLLDTGKYAEADPIYEQLGRSYALSGRLGRAEALLGLGRIDDAAVQLSGLSEELRNTSQARETAARVAIAQGKAGDAVALLRPLLDGENKRASALALYGDALYAVDQVDSAAGAYDAALALDSTLPEARLGRAETYLRAEKPKDALEQLDKVKATIGDRLRPPSLRARMLMQYGHAYVQRDKRDDLEHARDMLREAVKIPGAPAEAFFWLGEALGGRKTPEAASALKHYLELAPKGAYAERARRSLGPLL